MGHVEKATILFGFKADGSGTLTGHPLRTERLNVGIVPAETANWVAVPAPFGTPITVERSSERINVPTRFSTDGAVSAIGIAPDSPIEAVDLYIGGETGKVHRIGVGCPFVGEIADNTQVLVAPVRDLPAPLRREYIVGTLSGDGAARATKFWDMDVVLGEPTIFTVPVRLNLFRSGAPSSAVIKRAQYTANMIYEVVDVGAGVSSIPGVMVIVDGRRRVRVVAGGWPGGAASGNLHVYGIEGRSGYIGDRNSSAVFPTADWPLYDEILAPTAVAAYPTPLVFDYGGGGANPYFAIQCAIEGATIGTRGYITVRAWDD